MELSNLVEKLESGLNAKRVFSEPIERDGSVVVLAATVRGGGGGGGGGGTPASAVEKATGEGSGFGLLAKPAGAFVIRNGRVRWRPAVDVNRVILGGQLVMLSGLLLARALVERSAARRRFARRLFVARRARKLLARARR